MFLVLYIATQVSYLQMSKCISLNLAEVIRNAVRINTAPRNRAIAEEKGPADQNRKPVFRSMILYVDVMGRLTAIGVKLVHTAFLFYMMGNVIKRLPKFRFRKESVCPTCHCEHLKGARQSIEECEIASVPSQ
jgi:hypothetical protein